MVKRRWTWRGVAEPVCLNLWDFGGQDIYHGSHALFLHGHAIFLILWTPELERQTTYQEDSLSLRHRPLSYWVDYLRAFAGTDASMLIVQSQCDTRDKRMLHPPAQLDDFPYHRSTEVSARTGLNLGILKAEIKEAARDRFGRRPPPPIGAGRLKVRDRLRQNGDIVCWNEKNLRASAPRPAASAIPRRCLISCTITAPCFTGQAYLAVASSSTRIGRWKPSTPSSTERRSCRCSGATVALIGPISKDLSGGTTPPTSRSTHSLNRRFFWA